VESTVSDQHYIIHSAAACLATVLPAQSPTPQ
jgi:hypothetical protein